MSFTLFTCTVQFCLVYVLASSPTTLARCFPCIVDSCVRVNRVDFLFVNLCEFLSSVALSSLRRSGRRRPNDKMTKKEQLCVRITFYTIAYFVFFLFRYFEDLILDLESSSLLESIAFLVRGRGSLRFLFRSIILTAVLYRERSYF